MGDNLVVMPGEGENEKQQQQGDFRKSKVASPKEF